MTLACSGLTVTDVSSGSVVAGPSGIRTGDVMTELNGCPLKTSADFRHCTLKAIRRQVRLSQLSLKCPLPFFLLFPVLILSIARNNPHELCLNLAGIPTAKYRASKHDILIFTVFTGWLVFAVITKELVRQSRGVRQRDFERPRQNVLPS